MRSLNNRSAPLEIKFSFIRTWNYNGHNCMFIFFWLFILYITPWRRSKISCSAARNGNQRWRIPKTVSSRGRCIVLTWRWTRRNHKGIMAGILKNYVNCDRSMLIQIFVLYTMLVKSKRLSVSGFVWVEKFLNMRKCSHNGVFANLWHFFVFFKLIHANNANKFFSFTVI